jgi:hypothetical protein
MYVFLGGGPRCAGCKRVVLKDAAGGLEKLRADEGADAYERSFFDEPAEGEEATPEDMLGLRERIMGAQPTEWAPPPYSTTDMRWLKDKVQGQAEASTAPSSPPPAPPKRDEWDIDLALAEVDSILREVRDEKG